MGQLPALLQGDRYAAGVHEEVVLVQKAGEEHPVPMFVSHLSDQMIEFLLLSTPRIPRLMPPSPESEAQFLLLWGQMGIGFGLPNGQPLQGGFRSILCLGTGREDGLF